MLVVLMLWFFFFFLMCVYVVACQKMGVNLEFSFAATVKVLRVFYVWLLEVKPKAERNGTVA